MTAIKPADSTLRDKIDSDGYNETLNEINSKYAEMDKYIENLQSDINAVRDFEKDVIYNNQTNQGWVMENEYQINAQHILFDLDDKEVGKIENGVVVLK